MKNGLESRIKSYIEAKNLAEKLGLERDFKIRFLAQGEYNINYLVEDRFKKLVFRANTASQLGLENQIEYEYNALKALELSGVTPRAHYVDGKKDVLDYGVLVMEFLEGVPLDYGKDLRTAASIFGKIHSLDTEGLEETFIVESDILSSRVREARMWLGDYMNSPKADAKLKRFFQNFLEWAEANSHKEAYFNQDRWHVVNNTEVNSHNFIIGDERSYLIDWEKPVISDPCQDITQFMAETTTSWKGSYVLTRDEKKDFFKHYVKSLSSGDRGIEERVQIYAPYLYLRALSWCAYAWLEYQNPDKEIRNIDTLMKIEQYLDLDFMEKLIAPLR
jgi:predicted Ser/Thr protein kinase